MILIALLLAAAAAGDPTQTAPSPEVAPVISPAVIVAKAPDGATASAPAPATPAAVDKVTCHSDIRTGTRFGSTKECHTEREWRRIDGERVTAMDKATGMKWSETQ